MHIAPSPSLRTSLSAPSVVPAPSFAATALTPKLLERFGSVRVLLQQAEAAAAPEPTADSMASVVGTIGLVHHELDAIEALGDPRRAVQYAAVGIRLLSRAAVAKAGALITAPANQRDVRHGDLRAQLALTRERTDAIIEYLRRNPD
ncbi:MAG: hypothetical protein KDC46_07245 [Thermoleophilia bacterium]|nr:hypothetical protein [Thermoleophilia bacterium]